MDLQALMNYYNTHNPFCQRIGISVEELRTGYARTVKTVTEEDTNPLGVPHGGLYFTMADNACGFAMSTHGFIAVTVNSTFNFMRGAQIGDHLTAEAFEIKGGKTIAVYEARVTNQSGELIANGTFTFFRMDKQLDFNFE